MAHTLPEDLLDELEGWSPALMSRTVGKLFKTVSHMADRLQEVVATKTAGVYGDGVDVDGVKMKNLASAIGSITKSLDQ